MGLLDKFKQKKPETKVETVEADISKLLQEKKYSEALEILNKNFDENNNKNWLTRGELYTKLGKKEESLESYLKATNLDDSSIIAWFNVGQRRFEFGDFEKAAIAFDKTLKLEEGKEVKKWSNLATFYSMMSWYMAYLDDHNMKTKMKISEQIATLQKVIGVNEPEEKFLKFCSENFQNIVTKLDPNSNKNQENPE